MKRKYSYYISVAIPILAILAPALFYVRHTRKFTKRQADIEKLEMSLQ